MVHLNDNKKKFHKITNWITYGLTKSINHRDKLYAKQKRTNTNHKKFKQKQIIWQVYNNILKHAIKQAKIHKKFHKNIMTSGEHGKQ